MLRLLNRLQDLLDKTRAADFLAPLLLRLYLVPVFWMAGSHKINFSTLLPHDSVVQWFGNPDWGLGLPLPALMAFMAAWTEILGALLLLVGFAVRWISIPLMITMLVAAFTVHWQKGWLAIAEANSVFATERTQAAVERLDQAKDILKQHGDYQFLTEHGSLAILNNGIEFAATYFVMLLTLFFLGAGRYISLDDWIGRYFRRPV